MHVYSCLPLLPPLSFYRLLKQNAYQLYIATNGRYDKQHHPNRFTILSAQGVLTLTVPLAGGRNQKAPFNTIRIYEHDWQRHHLKTLQTCYQKAPFYEHLMPSFEAQIKPPLDTLYQLNKRLLKWSLSCLKIDHLVSIHLLHDADAEMILPTVITPEIVPYLQLFGTQFTPHLSIIDALFNHGPYTLQYL